VTPSVNSSKPLKIRSGASVVSRHSLSIGSASTEAWAAPGAGPARWMMNAIAGASATITKGKTTATVSTPATSRRVSETSGDDSSMTGNKLKADIDHSDTSRTPANGAITAGVSSTAQNAATAKRRCGDAGHAMSLTAAAVGRAMKSTSSRGTAT